MVWEFDRLRKLSKLGFAVDFSRYNDYEQEIFHLIATEFLRLDNEELTKKSKRR